VSRPVAFFDFDGTLTRGDSLLPFLRMLVGPGRFYKNLARLSPVFVAYALKILDNGLAKEIVLRNYLSGMRLDELNDAGQKFATEVLPKIECTTGMARYIGIRVKVICAYWSVLRLMCILSLGRPKLALMIILPLVWKSMPLVS